ncbi:hypothetical protein HNO88_003515 [Novosphingobium chloroacetimidivorans]|uniref:Uncharacterized protein n=1 Tax=Novosphingobium chloroacetimidivorans TaxID=1428314 RepID=A0A7W7KC84_9SPHN|nr:hypothetical protein [Novosphingobium chloroacetimidivorans]MBB4860174.1 hypothetical protein [Novosphingobium chloroacetimidivorans]
MSGGGEYEPKDSRRVVGTKGDPEKSWREEEDPRAERGEYEPVDSRNVTGQAANDVDRWKNSDKRPPRVNGDTSKQPDPDASR